MDEKGWLKLVDRKKDLIVVSGFNVYPNEIEEVVASNDKVLEVACIGVKSEKTGEAIKVFVVRKDPSLTKEELIDFCRKELTAYKVPKDIEFRDELPKSNVGKILRRAALIYRISMIRRLKTLFSDGLKLLPFARIWLLQVKITHSNMGITS